MTKYRRLGGLSNRNSFSHSSGSGKSKIKVAAHSVFGEGSPGLQGAPSHYVLTWPFLVVCAFTAVSSYKDSNGGGSGPHPYDFI